MQDTSLQKLFLDHYDQGEFPAKSSIDYGHDLELDEPCGEQRTSDGSIGMSNGDNGDNQTFEFEAEIGAGIGAGIGAEIGAKIAAKDSIHQEKTKNTPDVNHRGDLTVLAIVSVVFIILFTMQNVLVKYQNRILNIKLPWLTALTLTIGWPLNGLIWFYYDRCGKLNKLWILKRYGLLGFLDALHLSLLSFGLNNLPGSTYTLLKGSAVIWNVLLSRIILRKRIPYLHYISVLIMCASTIIVGVAKGVDRTVDEEDPKRMIWIFCAVASAFANAFQAVIAQYLFDVKSKKKSMRIVAETTFFNGLFSFLFLLVPVFVSDEYLDWGGDFKTTADNGVLDVFILSCLGIGASKQLGYFTKFAAVSHSTALYAGVLDTVRRAIVVIAVVLLFDEKFSWQKGIATGLTFVGFGVYILGSHLKRREADQQFDKVQEEDPDFEKQQPNTPLVDDDELSMATLTNTLSIESPPPTTVYIERTSNGDSNIVRLP